MFGSIKIMIMSYLQRAYNFFTQCIAPAYCLFCKQNMPDRQALCSTCLITVLPIIPYDFHIGRNQDVKIYAMAAYKDPLKKLIVAKHFNNAVPSLYLAKMMCEQSILQYLEFDIIVFIPLHWTRYAARGFNQAEVIAKEIARSTNKPMIPLLVRSKKTQFQARLSVHERAANVRDAFIINQRYQHEIVGKKILLIDDLFTTGSTVKSAAHILFQYNPIKIDVFVACRVIS